MQKHANICQIETTSWQGNRTNKSSIAMLISQVTLEEDASSNTLTHSLSSLSCQQTLSNDLSFFSCQYLLFTSFIVNFLFEKSSFFNGSSTPSIHFRYNETFSSNVHLGNLVIYKYHQVNYSTVDTTLLDFEFFSLYISPFH